MDGLEPSADIFSAAFQPFTGERLHPRADVISTNWYTSPICSACRIRTYFFLSPGSADVPGAYRIGLSVLSLPESQRRHLRMLRYPCVPNSRVELSFPKTLYSNHQLDMSPATYSFDQHALVPTRVFNTQGRVL